jgi:hypothetical protein
VLPLSDRCRAAARLAEDLPPTGQIRIARAARLREVSSTVA